MRPTPPRQTVAKRAEDPFLRAKLEPTLLTLPPAQYLAIDGAGSPESPAFHAAIQAIYGVAYTIKFALRKARRPDFKVGQLEGLWRNPTERKTSWRWTLLIRVPPSVTPTDVAKAIAAKAKDGGGELAAVKLVELAEGEVVQVLHVGPYSAEGATLAKLQGLLRREGLSAWGPHHEIYLGDPRRTPPEKLKTILRQPVHHR